MKEPVQSMVSRQSPSLANRNDPNHHVHDFLIIGSGISGINTAYRIQEQAGTDNYVILESRSELGGTWSFFKYPGLRSDSDLFTFGFPWRPWRSDNPIASAESILEYLHDSVKETGIDKHILYRHTATSADWSTSEQLWKVTVDAGGEQKLFRARYMVLATGYYSYDEPLETVIPGLENFKGKSIHAQFWPEGYDYANKRMIIIGSGATAITLLPVLAEKAKHVTMLQRSPSYILSLSNSLRAGSAVLSSVFPSWVVDQIHRTFFLIISYALYYFCRLFPALSRKLLLAQSRRHLAGAVPISPHFEPSYQPWDQRLCICPDADFYKALRSGKGSVVTNVIDQVTADGIRLTDGTELPADVIITATGLKLFLGGGVNLTIDGKPFKIADKRLWRGMMLQDVPNLCFIIGYTNASWTLGADATAQTFTRLYRAAQARGASSSTPRLSAEKAAKMKFSTPLGLKSTYILKAKDAIPLSGDRGPWKARWNYLVDMWKVRWTRVDEDIEFVTPQVDAEKVFG